MYTTQDHGTVARLSAGIPQIANDVLLLILSQRDELPHAANGRPIAPSNPSAAQILKDMGQGKSREVERLLTVLLCNTVDGVQMDIVKLVLRRIEAAIDLVGRTTGPRPISALNRRETREECLLNLTQLRAEADQNDVDALRALIEQCAHYLSALNELRTEADRRLIWLVGGGESPSAPRPHLVRMK
jgi:hypothetical protein